jgi:hypothetical protein
VPEGGAEVGVLFSQGDLDAVRARVLRGPPHISQSRGADEDLGTEGLEGGDLLVGDVADQRRLLSL